MSTTKQALEDASEAFAAAEEAYMAHLNVAINPGTSLTAAWANELHRLKVETVAKENAWRALIAKVHGMTLPAIHA